MSDGESDASVFEISLGLVIFCLFLLAAAWGLTLAAECLTTRVLAIHSNEFLVLVDQHSDAYRILMSGVTALLLLGGLWAFHWFFERAGLPWFEAVFSVAGIVLAAVFPYDLCHVF